MTMRVLSSCLSAFLLLKGVEGGMVQFNPIESLFSGNLIQTGGSRAANSTARLQRDPNAPTPEQREGERANRRERMQERNGRIKDVMQMIRPDTVERVSPEELASLEEEHPSLRKLGWNSWAGNGNSGIQYADPGEDYDMWQQAYRMLGGFIDCDHSQDGEGSHDNNDNQDEHRRQEEGGDAQPCSRWMLWASYIDPNYQGNGYYEYFGDTPTSKMDCHHPNTEWQLLGVYRQEFYQFIEQISKHLWALDEYEYVVALAGLAYMTDDDCFYVGTTSGGDSIYAGIAPQEYGGFQMALYTDGYCLTPNENTGYTFDSYGLYSDVNLASGEGDDGGGGDYSWADEWWQDTQEYTLSQLNGVYDDFKYCTSCIDYPTYQDGYYIGDTGTDEDDLINQCWKFYSHDSYPCEADCVAMAHAQGTILSVVLEDKMYGKPQDDFYSDSTEVSSTKTSSAVKIESQFSRLLANVFVTFSFIVFVATFLAFAVARRSRYRESRTSKSRRLLDDDDGRSPRSKRSSRSKSKGRDEDGDGLFRTTSRKSSRSKSRSKKQRSRGTSERDDEYEPPRTNRRSRSRGAGDDF